jgi:hypothetical protein
MAPEVHLNRHMAQPVQRDGSKRTMPRNRWETGGRAGNRRVAMPLRTFFQSNPTMFMGDL